MSELIPEENKQNVNEENKQNVNNVKKNKKIILWSILVVLVLIILYVLFGDENKKYRLNTDTRKDLAQGAVLNPLSETSSNTVGTVTSFSSTSPNTPTSSTNVSSIRRQLTNLFKSYA